MELIQHRSRALAFFLNFFPGLGQYYLGNRIKALLYPIMFFGCLGLAFVSFLFGAKEPFIFVIVVAFLIWCVSMLHILIDIIRYPKYPTHPTNPNHYPDQLGFPHMEPTFGGVPHKPDSERFFTILLSFVPGLGHFYMGLMQRGLSFLIAFFGLLTMLIFVTTITSQNGFAVFLGLLPVIWLYCMFDAVQVIHRKQKGEIIEDRTLFDEIEAHRVEGRRSKVLATILSAFPGAGHMYLGLQKRGLQLMVGFLGSIYILDALRLSIFLFLIPLIWCYSFFDGLQQLSRYGREELKDAPIITGFMNHQRWLGLGLLFLGAYYLAYHFLLPIVENYFPGWLNRYIIQDYLQTVIISLLFIGGGIKLLTDSKKHQSRGEESDGNQ